MAKVTNFRFWPQCLTLHPRKRLIFCDSATADLFPPPSFAWLFTRRGVSRKSQEIRKTVGAVCFARSSCANSNGKQLRDIDETGESTQGNGHGTTAHASPRMCALRHRSCRVLSAESTPSCFILFVGCVFVLVLCCEHIDCHPPRSSCVHSSVCVCHLMLSSSAHTSVHLTRSANLPPAQSIASLPCFLHFLWSNETPSHSSLCTRSPHSHTRTWQHQRKHKLIWVSTGHHVCCVFCIAIHSQA